MNTVMAVATEMAMAAGTGTQRAVATEMAIAEIAVDTGAATVVVVTTMVAATVAVMAALVLLIACRNQNSLYRERMGRRVTSNFGMMAKLHLEMVTATLHLEMATAAEVLLLRTGLN